MHAGRPQQHSNPPLVAVDPRACGVDTTKTYLDGIREVDPRACGVNLGLEPRSSRKGGSRMRKIDEMPPNTAPADHRWIPAHAENRLKHDKKRGWAGGSPRMQGKTS